LQELQNTYETSDNEELVATQEINDDDEIIEEPYFYIDEDALAEAEAELLLKEAQETDNIGFDDKKPKVNMSQKMFDYFKEHTITCQQHLYDRPTEEWSEFVIHPRFNSLCTTYFGVIGGMARQKCFWSGFNLLTGDKYAEAVAVRGERIKGILKMNTYSDERIAFFIKALMMVVQRKSKKQNTFYLMGKSNSGKSMLMETFVRTYFANTFGCPNGNVRSRFPFSDCIGKRIILWEEPIVHAQNFEDAKKILGGQQHRTDQKYQTGAEIAATPVIMTSNRPCRS
jgi:hypothetical protein